MKYGIRPEHLELGSSGSQGKIAAEIIVVEPMGAETELVVKVGDATLNVMSRGRSNAGPGDKVFLAPDPSNAHLFDAATGLRI